MNDPPSDHLHGPSTVATTGHDEAERVDVGIVVANSPREDEDRLYAFAERMARDAAAELESATDVAWQFTAEEPAPLPDGETRRPSQFLDEAMDRIVDGPYDLIVVVTDVPLVSRSQRFVPGLPSRVSRVVVVSTRKLLRSSRDEPSRSLDSESVRWNAATLLLHLFGHVLGAGHGTGDGGVMEPFEFDPSRRSVPEFVADVEAYLHRVASRTPKEGSPRGRVRRFGFYVLSALRNPGQVLGTLAHSRAIAFPLSLPKLATAAITPTLVIVFSAESWDVGLHLTNGKAALFAVGSVLAAAVHLMFVQNLFFPRRRRQVVTEHMALVNVTVFLVLLGAMVGLFLLVSTVMLVIEFLVFPPTLMATWPSLENPTVRLVDRVRTAGFISTIGVLSGALAGGLENREILRHLALFDDRP